MSTLSTHILDISTGTPAEGVTVSLSREGETLANTVTNARGRIATFSAEPLPAGRYCLTAETGAWFARAGRESVFTRAQIDFVIGGGRGPFPSAVSHRPGRVVDLPRQLSRLLAAGRRCACPAWIVTERVETARRPGKAQPPPACTGGSGDHPSCFIPTQG